MQLNSIILGENKRHMIMIFNIKVIYTFNHNNLLITSLKVFDFLYHLSPKKLFNVAWPPPAGIGRHNDASSTNKTFKTEWAEFVGSHKQYGWFSHYASFYNQYGQHQRKNLFSPFQSKYVFPAKNIVFCPGNTIKSNGKNYWPVECI